MHHCAVEEFSKDFAAGAWSYKLYPSASPNMIAVAWLRSDLDWISIDVHVSLGYLISACAHPPWMTHWVWR